jgi:uncharacterized repeat protein (TIGR01451 family)
MWPFAVKQGTTGGSLMSEGAKSSISVEARGRRSMWAHVAARLRGRTGRQARRGRMYALALVSSLVVGTLPMARAEAADPVPVTVRIKCILQVENPDTASGDGDYFPQVKIDDHDFSIHPDFSGPLGPGPIQDDDFCPDWRFTRTVDRTGPIDIVIRLWDDDGGLNFGGDLMDISPKPGKVDLFVRFNGASGRWDISESDVQGSIARGNGDHGIPRANDGRIAQIEFEVFLGSNPDHDGDGIPDAVENNGVRKADGTLITDLKALGGTPCRPTVVVWIDYMSGAADRHTHKPKEEAIDMVVDAFDSAPPDAGPCLYTGARAPKTRGLDFIYLEGRSIPEQAVLSFPHKDGDTDVPDSGYRVAKAANFPGELRPYAHYAIFAHDQKAGSSSSGLCCDGDGGNRDFLVTLGSWRSTCVAAGDNGTLDTTRQGDDVKIGESIDVGPDLTCNTTANTTTPADDEQWLNVDTGAADARMGTVHDQAGTLMHELGHALGLGHGGDMKVNHKPNYLSVMNYSLQGGIPRGPTPAGAAAPPMVVDYSRRELALLDEFHLKESAGIGSGLTEWTRWTDPDGTERWASAAGAIDWDWSGTVDDGTVDCGDGTSVCVAVDINADDDSGTEFPPEQSWLTGFDDWSNLKYRAIEAPTAGASSAAEHPSTPALDFRQTLTSERLFFEFFDPDVATKKVADKAQAEGGDEITYTVTVDNVGTGPAASASVTDTFPVGQGQSPQTRQLGTLYPGASRTETFKLTVGCATPDGTVLVNSATASGTDMGGGAEANLANNTATASTTVSAPQLEVTKTATGSVLAGEAVTYRVTIDNVGTAVARNVRVEDVLPADVYYSKALDVGAGPTPDSVTREPDGTTTLGWSVGTVGGGASATLEYTARPSLLFLAGESVANAVEVTYENSNGCTFDPEHAFASTTITVVDATRDPGTVGFWRNHEDLWQGETLARVQATDQRWDSDGDGRLSSDEARAALLPGGDVEYVLQKQLLATYFNLATRRINAGTGIDSRLTRRLGLANVRDAAIYAKATLLLPATKEDRDRYSDATTVLDQTNNNRSTVY